MSTDFAKLVGFPNPSGTPEIEVHGTTVLALAFQDGVIVLADRRATMGNLIMFDRAEKIEALDDATVLAISGAYARSVEVCRFLRHSFKFYERMNLVPLSTDGKLMAITQALANNLVQAVNGGGLFLPIAATYDANEDKFQIHSFDAAGARFHYDDFACAGSGSERIRGIFDYIRTTKSAWKDMSREDALREGLRMLAIAADLDSATGGFDKVPPRIAFLTRQGVQMMADDEFRAFVSTL